MSAQLSLFRETSREAMLTADIAGYNQLAYDFIASQGEYGATSSEIEQAYPGRQMHQRAGYLERKGLVYDSGEKRRTPSGRRAIVWRARQHPIGSCSGPNTWMCADCQEARERAL